MKPIKSSLTSINQKLVCLLGCLVIGACAAVPKLSKEEKQLIKEVLKAPVREVVLGETGRVQVPGHQIWFEHQRPSETSKGTIILIMGNGNDALTWPQNFITRFLDAGYGVVRFDHRETGLSTSEKKWKAKRAYSLNDMSEDVAAILDTLAIEKAHVVGVSMGGMIAQILTIEHPERVESLTAIMSSANVTDPELSPMSQEIFPAMISAVFKHGFFGNTKGQIKLQIVHRKILMGRATGQIDVRTMAETSLYNLKKRAGYNLLSARHHFKAIQMAEPRYEALSKSLVPILLIHGEEDPVMPISHSKKMASLLPDSDTLWVKNMGHDLPDAAVGTITDKMLSHFNSKR